MLINCDVKSLEVFVAADRYDDKTLQRELLDRLDIHALNQEALGFPPGKEGRLVAKIFIFRLIYGGTAYSYTMDPDFASVGYSERQWQRTIDAFFNKYPAIAAGHQRDLKFVKENGYLTTPAGRYFNLPPKKTGFGWTWPETKIKNYPIQSFGADLVKLARIEFFKRLKCSGLEGEFIQTIHDSLVVDTPEKNVYNISVMLKESVEAVPQLCKEAFDYDFNLPLWCEVMAGPNKYDMSEIKFH